MPAGKAQGGGVNRRFAWVEQTDGSESDADIADLSLLSGKARAVAVQAKEQVRPFRGLPIEPPILADGGQAVGPDQFQRIVAAGEHA
jgi:hypothetical protein